MTHPDPRQNPSSGGLGPTTPPGAGGESAAPPGPHQPASGPPGYQAPPYYAYQPPPGTNSYAVAAMIVSLAALLVCPLIGALGIYLGNRARKEIAQTGEQGDGMALAGIIVGWIGVGLSILSLLLVGAYFLFMIGFMASFATVNVG